MSEELYSAQTDFFREISERVMGKTGFVIVGDFNSTPFSTVFRSYFGKFFDVTAYSWGTRSIFTIPIDHALTDKPADVRT